MNKFIRIYQYIVYIMKPNHVIKQYDRDMQGSKSKLIRR
jgi:hypothetical protein